MLSDCEQNHSMAWAPRLTTRIGEGESELRASLFLSLLPGQLICEKLLSCTLIADGADLL